MHAQSPKSEVFPRLLLELISPYCEGDFCDLTILPERVIFTQELIY
jgi:hypothetical protein